MYGNFGSGRTMFSGVVDMSLQILSWFFGFGKEQSLVKAQCCSLTNEPLGEFKVVDVIESA